jgi:hypothetical protein
LSRASIESFHLLEIAMRKPEYFLILAGFLLFGFGMLVAYQGAVPKESSLTTQDGPHDH